MKTWEARAVRERSEALTEAMSSMEGEVLDRASKIQERPLNIHQFHGIIGSKNDEYANVYRARFFDPDDFVARWLKGLVQKAREDERKAIEQYGEVRFRSAALRVIDLLRDQMVRQYTLLFLERNFYRQLAARIRAKPEEKLWSLWFGNNQLTWGLIIAGSYWQGEWRSRAHEVRHAEYAYWSIGHVLQEGLVIPNDPQRKRFADLDDFLQFYRQVLTRISNSAYERGIADLYEDYVRGSPEPNAEPFLIPELRYAGLAREHMYRVDYALFNAHSMQYVGFELSPHSTHLAIKGMKGQTQAAVNARLSAQWAKEMDKRNVYFAGFDLPIITFTDEALGDLPGCFTVMADYLRERPAEPVTIEQQFSALDEFAS